MKLSSAFVCALLACIVFVAACEVQHSPGLQTDVADILRRGNGGDPGTFDPALAEDVHAFNILTDLYEGLTSESAGGDVAPGVAKSWLISDDGLEYTFKLRSDARWSNGDLVSAADFVRAFRRVASPDTHSSYSFLLDPIQNFSEVRDGTVASEALGVRAIDTQTLMLNLNTPTPYILSVLSMPIAFPVHASLAESGLFSRAENFVGNGAYVLADATVGMPALLRRNDMYWDADSVHFTEIEYFPIADPNTEMNMYNSGELDITNTIPPNNIKQLKNSSPDEIRIAPSLAFYYLAFDLTEAPFDNLALRESLSLAIDRNQLVELIGRGEQPAYSIVPPGVANHSGAQYEWRSEGPLARETRARRRYAAAGYSESNPLTMKLTYDVGDIHERIALAVSAMWRDVLSIDVELEKKEWKYFLATREDRAIWDVMRFSWFGDYNDPLTFLEIFRSNNVQNLPKYRDPEFDDLVERAARETDPNSRFEMMADAEAGLLEDFPIVPLYFYVSKHLVKPEIDGFVDNILDRHPSKYLSIKRNEDRPD